MLAEQPGHEGARAGVRVLLALPACRPDAVALLLVAFEETGDWSGRLSLLEHRLEAAKDAAERTALLLEAADLDEARAHDEPAALAAIARALPLSPADTTIEARLCAWARRPGISRRSRARSARRSSRRTRTRGRRSSTTSAPSVLESRIADLEGALEAYLAALDLAGDRLDAATAAVRTATQQGRWDVAARTLVASAQGPRHLQSGAPGADGGGGGQRRGRVGRGRGGAHLGRDPGRGAAAGRGRGAAPHGGRVAPRSPA